MIRGPGGRATAGAVACWAVLAFVVWNGFFDVLVTRGEQHYLLTQARHELGLGPRVTIDDVMTRTIGDAARVASIWAGIVCGAGVVSTVLARRSRRRDASIAGGAPGERALPLV